MGSPEGGGTWSSGHGSSTWGNSDGPEKGGDGVAGMCVGCSGEDGGGGGSRVCVVCIFIQLSPFLLSFFNWKTHVT